MIGGVQGRQPLLLEHVENLQGTGGDVSIARREYYHDYLQVADSDLTGCGVNTMAPTKALATEVCTLQNRYIYIYIFI